MAASNKTSRLQELWENPTEPRCFTCSQPIGEKPLIRTFRPRSRNSVSEALHCSRIIPDRTWDYLVFDRHQYCCPPRKTFIALSHVWDPSVSAAHHEEHPASEALQFSVSEYIFKMLERLSNGLSAYLEGDTEIWYDYVSVPQWERDVKLRILEVIPYIFRELSMFTLIYLHDVETECLKRLRIGSRPHEDENNQVSDRAWAVTQICNAKWFSRVWTISEFIHSPNVKVMKKEGHVDQHAHQALILRLARVWEEESEKFKTVQEMKQLIGIGQNLVPRNLVLLVRARNREQVDFGFAFTFLSRRGCYSDTDFCLALFGLVKTDLKGEPLDKTDPTQLMIQIATACMRAGDYSPLLMVPRHPDHDSEGPPPHILAQSGYADVAAFGLGNGKIGNKK